MKVEASLQIAMDCENDRKVAMVDPGSKWCGFGLRLVAFKLFQPAKSANICKYQRNILGPPSNQQEYVDIRCYLKPRNQDHPRLPYPLAVLGAGIDFHQGIWRPIQSRGMSWEFHGSHTITVACRHHYPANVFDSAITELFSKSPTGYLRYLHPLLATDRIW